MSKKNPSNTSPAEPVTPETETPTEITEVAEVAQTVPASSLVPITDAAYDEVLDTQLLFDPHGPHARQILLKLFPTMARELRGYKPVSDEELTKMIFELPNPFGENLNEALERMNPEMIGVHHARQSSMRLFELKIYHGTGNDSSRPSEVPAGGLYTQDGRVQATGEKKISAALKLPETFAGYIIASYDAGILWPPKAEDEDEGKSLRVPLCATMDRHMGSTHGLCDACPHRPFKPGGEKGDCLNEQILFIVPLDFSGIYRMRLSKTGMESAKMIKKAMAAGWRSPWEKAFTFATQARTSKEDPNIRWYVAQPAPIDTVTEPSVAASLRVLARKIDTEVYWPTLRETYLRAMNPELRQGSGAGSDTKTKAVTDGSALAALAGGASQPVMPDLSAKAPPKNI